MRCVLATALLGLATSCSPGGAILPDQPGLGADGASGGGAEDSGSGGATDSGGGGQGDSGGSAGEGEACNGHPELCARRLDEVTFPGTHNSMSNSDAGWYFPNQEHGITRQLEDGVRALMLDTHDYWGEPYLCHSYCELGKQPLVEGLGEVRAFLAANPREVVIIIFQDAITVEETVAVFESLGLDEQVWTWDPDAQELPTLGELVEGGQQLVVSAEVSGPPPGWYHHAWDLVVDTPYSFSSAEEFSCELNRGSAENPLFLVNHWVGTPLPTEEGSREVNTAEVLGGRARQCAEEWSRPVNILAVDFYEEGALLEVVRELNGLGG